MIIFYFGSISAKAPVCQPHITKTQQKKKLILKVVFRLNLRLTFFVCILLHYTDIKSEEKVYSKVCIFPLSSHIQGGFFFFSPRQQENRHSLSFLMHLFLSVSPFAWVWIWILTLINANKWLLLGSTWVFKWASGGKNICCPSTSFWGLTDLFEVFSLTPLGFSKSCVISCGPEVLSFLWEKGRRLPTLASLMYASSY